VILSPDGGQIQGRFDLGILDGPTMDRMFERVQARRAVEGPVFLPFLLVTNRKNIRYITRHLWTTVDELILTPIEKVELAARVEILLRARRLSLETQRMAITDPLTGVHNRRHFFVLAEREMAKIRRTGLTPSVIMLDIDRFKTINDTYGHLVGDQVLVNVAKRCRAMIRESDIFGRYGGEEFIIFLPETALPDAIRVADRMRKEVARSPIVTDTGEEIQVTISMGVSSAEGADTELEALIDSADRALYVAKCAGRNRVMSA